MTLVTCKECGAKVSTKATTCPTCGAKQRQTSGCTMAFVWIVGIFTVILVAGAIISTPTPTLKAPSKSNSSNVDQEDGRQFIGLTRQQLIEKLGQPVQTAKGSNPKDGNFEILTYDDSNANATLFTIWESDGYVSEGQYRGKSFSK